MDTIQKWILSWYRYYPDLDSILIWILSRHGYYPDMDTIHWKRLAWGWPHTPPRKGRLGAYKQAARPKTTNKNTILTFLYLFLGLLPFFWRKLKQDKPFSQTKPNQSVIHFHSFLPPPQKHYFLQYHTSHLSFLLHWQDFLIPIFYTQKLWKTPKNYNK